MLTQEQANNYFEYKDGHIYWKVDKSKIAKKGNLAGTLSKRDGRYRTICDGKQYLNHRIIFLMHYGYLSEEIDHINGNPSDNKIENLRATTKTQNQWNRKVSCNCKSKVKGVHWHKQHKKWYARITVNKKRINVGLFESLDEAAKAISNARIEYHGEYRRD